MKSLTTYITEKLKLDGPEKYNYFPKTREELDDIIAQLIKERGNNADLNDIDVSKIDDFNCLFGTRNFYWFEHNKSYNFTEFNGDISEWNTSNAESMAFMFSNSKFDGNISDWNTSKVYTMEYMFEQSEFTGKNGDISNWDVSKVSSMDCMFFASKYDGDLSEWDMSNVNNAECMFRHSKFTGKNGDISKWDISNMHTIEAMFEHSNFHANLSNWKIPEKCVADDLFSQLKTTLPDNWMPQNYNGN